MTHCIFIASPCLGRVVIQSCSAGLNAIQCKCIKWFQGSAMKTWTGHLDLVLSKCHSLHFKHPNGIEVGNHAACARQAGLLKPLSWPEHTAFNKVPKKTPNCSLRQKKLLVHRHHSTSSKDEVKMLCKEDSAHVHQVTKGMQTQ